MSEDGDFTEENADELAEELMGSLDGLFETDQIADDARPVARMPRESYCRHRRVRLAGESRRVYCRDCEREVPAFDVLDDLAFDWETYMHTREDAQKRAKTATENLTELLRLERNAKGRLKNATKRAPKCSCAEEQREKDAARLKSWGYGGQVGDFWRRELPWCPRCGGKW